MKTFEGGQAFRVLVHIDFLNFSVEKVSVQSIYLVHTQYCNSAYVLLSCSRIQKKVYLTANTVAYRQQKAVFFLHLTYLYFSLADF